MPRNASGFYTLPLPPVVPGTVIESVWANTTLDDLAQAITNSLSRDGQGGMNAPFRIADGTVAAPGLAFTAETGSGLFRESAGVIGMSVLGTKVAQWSSAGYALSTLNVASINGGPDLSLNSTGPILFRIAAVTRAILGSNGYFGVRSSPIEVLSRLSIQAETPFDGSPTNISDIADSSIRLTSPGAVPGSVAGITYIGGPGAGSGGGCAITFRRDGTFGTSMRFYTSNASTSVGNINERMVIDSIGNVGIGTNAPGNNLTVSGTSTAGSSTSIGVANLQSSTSLGLNVTGTTFAGGGVAGSEALVSSSGTLTLGNINVAAPIKFVNNGAERMRFHASGRVAIGTTTDEAQLTIAYDRTVAPGIMLRQTVSDALGNAIQFRNIGGVTCGRIETTVNTTAYQSGASDYRLKNVLGPLETSGDFIDALKPCHGTWKADGGAWAGFLAHELREVCPGAASGEKDAVDKDGNPDYQMIFPAPAEMIANIVAELKSLRGRLAAAGL